jgi:RNA polymerase sigma factor
MLLSVIHRYSKKKNESQLNEKISLAKAGEEEVLNDLLLSHAPFMKKTASAICSRFIDEQHDEYSIALSAFHEAILNFDPDRNASLTTFAHLIIRRRLIDYLRKETQNHEHVQTNHLSSDEQEALDSEWEFIAASIERHREEEIAIARRDEIQKYNQLLESYGLSFDQLIHSSPKHKSSRSTAFQIADIIAGNEELHSFVMRTKRLPIKEISTLIEVSRKTIERHRKYILSIVLLLSSDFIYLKEYVKGEII